MELSCVRRGQAEVGIVTHDGRVFAAFGASVYGHNVTAYTDKHEGRMALATWYGKVMLACRSEVLREFHDGSLAIVFKLTKARYIVGYALGDHGCLFRGELIQGSDEERANHEALALAEFWMGIDAEDEADPWHGDVEDDQADGC